VCCEELDDPGLYSLGSGRYAGSLPLLVRRFDALITGYQLQANAEREYGTPNKPGVERPEPKDRKRLLQSRRRQEICEVLLDARQHHERAGGR